MMNQYSDRLAKIEAVLDEWLPGGASAVAAWAQRVFPELAGSIPAELFAGLTAPGRDLVSRGGKRWRPLLSTLVCESLGGGGAALPLAPLVEFCHNASLIHDDIEDSSDERRGKPAVHLIYGEDTAINSGCFMYFLPLACIEAWAPGPDNAAKRAALYAIWAGHMRRLHLGQAMDISWHNDSASLPPPELYFTMCRLKTGCLARLAAVTGAFAAGAPSQAGEKFGAAAEQLGVGFQILDDVKNLCEGIPGKKRGDDVVEGKKSLPVLLYLARRPEKRDFAARCFAAARKNGAAAPETAEFIDALSSDGVLEESRGRGLELIRESRSMIAAAFDEIPVGNAGGAAESRNALLALSEFLS